MSPDPVIIEPPPEPPDRWKVLYFSQVPWKVGERETDRDARLEAREAVDLRDLYPRSYPGQVISVIPATEDYSPADTAAPARSVLTMELTKFAREDLASGLSRIATDGLPILVTFDETHGAVAPELKRRFPLDFLVREAEEEAERVAVEERNRFADEGHLLALAAWAEEALAATELGLVSETPRPSPPEREPIPEPEFALTATKLGRLLAPTIVHSGAGLYKVDASGTTHDDTITSFNDNLLLQSEDLSTTWLNSGSTEETDAAAAPNGKTTADKLVEDSGTSAHQIYQVGSFTDTKTYIMSVHVKAAERTELHLVFGAPAFPANVDCWFNLSSGVKGTQGAGLDDAGISSLGDGWYRVWIIATADATTIAGLYLSMGSGGETLVYAGDGASGIYLWGMQLRNAASLGAYKPTRAATDTQITLADLDLTDSGLRGAWLNSAVDGTPDDASPASDDMANVGVPVYGTLGEVTLDGDDYLRRAEGDWRVADNVGTVTARITPGTVNNNSIWASADEGSENSYLSFCLRSTFLSVLSREDGTFNEVRGSTVLVAGRTYDVALVTNGSAWSLYVNGQVETLSVVSGANTGGWLDGITSRDNVTIGAIHRNVIEHYFNGAITDVRYYDSALSASDIEAISNGGDLTDGERDGEVFVSGGNGYGVVRNGVGSVLVAGDATAEAGACTISPYTTIQSGADQLFTDQGSTLFTMKQVIRFLAGIYDETFTPNASLDPNEDRGYTLILEGDPADDRANMSIAPSAGTHAVYCNCDQLLLRHLSIAGAPTTAYVENHTGCLQMEMDDCVITAANSTRFLNADSYGTILRNCAFSRSVDGWGLINYRGAIFAEHCVFKNTAAVPSEPFIYGAYSGLTLDSCVVIGWYSVNTAGSAWGNTGLQKFSNCTFYNQRGVVLFARSNLLEMHVIDCILSGALTMFGTTPWPEEASTYVGPKIVLRNNCYHGYTNFAIEAYGPTYKTYAEFIALNLVDASGDLDQTDPLLTDPGSGDFSLQTTSPCWDTGHGSGVTEDYLGSILDPAHPPIGAWSPGALVKTPPTMSVAVAGTTITFTLSGSSHRYRVRLSKADGTEVEEKSRAGAGDVAFTGADTGTHFRGQAWTVTADDAAVLGEPSIVHDAYVEASGAQTATGPLSLPVENARTLLSNSSNFQDMVGAGDAAGALGYIFYPYHDADTGAPDYLRPWAFLEAAEAWNSRQPALETVQIFLHDGEIALRIERDVDSAYQGVTAQRDAYLAFTNIIGAIISDLEAGAISYLDVRAIRIVEKARRVSRTKKAQGRDYYSTTLAVEWGG